MLGAVEEDAMVVPSTIEIDDDLVVTSACDDPSTDSATESVTDEQSSGAYPIFGRAGACGPG